MKKVLLFFFAFIFVLSAATAQDSKIHLRYNENSQRLTVSEPGYTVLRYDMYLYPANTHDVIGPCHVDNSNENIEQMSRFYDRVHPGDKVKMKEVRVMNMATKKAEWAPEYTIELR